MPAHIDSEKARTVRAMFERIAHRYDFLNHFLSGNIDRRWRRAFRERIHSRLGNVPVRILDVGCGTGDLSLEFAALGPVFGCDFCRPMLRIGHDKVAAARGTQVELLEADALRLPFGDSRFDVVVSAFVLRNLAGLEAGLREMHRVLREGGVIGILEFAMPQTPVAEGLYRFYFGHVLPRIGSLFSGVEGPYSYLPKSVLSFPPPRRLAKMIEAAGFRRVEIGFLTGGVAFVLSAEAMT